MDFRTILQNRNLLDVFYTDFQKKIFLCSSNQYALFHMKKKDCVKKNVKKILIKNVKKRCIKLKKNSREFEKIQFNTSFVLGYFSLKLSSKKLKM